MAGSTDSLSLALNQIHSLITNLNKKNFKTSCIEINHLVQQHGSEAERHGIRCLFSHIDFSNDGKTTGKDYHQIQYLAQEFGSLVVKPNFVSLICYAMDRPLSSQKTLRPQANMLHQVTKVLKLNRLHEVLFGIALMSSTSPETRTIARTLVQQKLPEFLRSYTDADAGTPQEFRLSDMSADALRLLLQAVLSREFGINSELRDNFVRLVRAEHPRDRVSALLGPLLYHDDKPLDLPLERLFPDTHTMPRSALELSLADVVLELGASCSTVEDFKRLISLVGPRDIVAATIAKVLGMLAKTVRCSADSTVSLQVFETASQRSGLNGQSGSGDTGLGSAFFLPSFGGQATGPGSSNVWNVVAFVEAVVEMLPTLRWRDVVAELDHPSFNVPTRDGFLLLVSAILRGLRETPFPIDIIYQRWKNSDGQLSFVAQALRNPDLFCFSQYPCRRVAFDNLKMLPEYEEKAEVQNWKSLDLVECLLRLSDSGVYAHVLELFRQPLELCPDLLLVGVLQAAPQLFNTMKRELIYILVSVFLNGHPNASTAMHYTWYCQANSSAIRALVLHAATDWYVRADILDGARLSRIVDVMHELKALSILLNSPNFLFVIDLACLAARREYVKLDKWLTDKIREHGETFVQAVITFLRRRCATLFLQRDELHQIQPQLISFTSMQMQASKAPMLTPEVVTTILGCLQTFSSSTQSQDLVETIMSAVSNGTYIFQAIKQRERQQALLGAQAQSQASLAKTPSAALLSAMGDPASGASYQPFVVGGLNKAQPASSFANASPSTPQPIVGGQFSGGPFAASAGLGGAFAGGLSGLQQGAKQSSASTAMSAMSLFGNTPTGSGPYAAQSGINQFSAAATGGASSTQVAGGSATSGASLLTGFGGFGGAMNKQQSNLSTAGNAMLNSMQAATTQSVGVVSESPITVLQHTSGIAAPGSQSQAAAAANEAQVQTRISQLAVALASTQPNEVDVSRLLKELPKSFAEDVESDANTFFKKIFSNAMQLDEILQKLKEMRSSDMQRSREGYQCILRNLLEEHRFYQQYPYEALLKTGMLIGGLIDESLVQNTVLAIVLFVILDALKQPVTADGGKMFSFACTALERCRQRLKEHTPVCSFIMRLPSYAEMLAKRTQLAEHIEYASRGLEPPARPASAAAQPQPQQVQVPVQPLSTASVPTATTAATPVSSSVKTTSSAANTTSTSTAAAAPKPLSITTANIATLMKAVETEAVTVSIPGEQVQDRIFFIFNNISQTNMGQKAAELKDHVPNEFLPWVAQYLVMKRVTIEPNFHNLYAGFVDALNVPGLHDTILTETYRNIHILLQQPKEPSNFTDRGLLKSLGHWLGLMTLARNKPILQDDLDLKSLLYEAFHRGYNELNSVVPFIGRTLESCANSRVFRPPNPWTIGLLNVLAELRLQPETKLSMTFEVEMICRHLNVQIDSLTPPNYLNDTSRLATLDSQLTAASRVKETAETNVTKPGQPATSAASAAASTAVREAATEGQSAIQQPPPAVAVSEREPPTAMPEQSPTIAAQSGEAAGASAPPPRYNYQELTTENVFSNLVANESLPLFQRLKHLRVLIRPAAERTIQDLAPILVERVVPTTVLTTEAIVRKDFAYDPDEHRMRQSALSMCRFLTAAMTLISARELVFVKLKEHIEAFLSSALRSMQNPKELLEVTCETLTQDNTELICAYIQKHVTERALEELERKLQVEFDARRQARHEGRAYFDPKALVLHQTLPDAIRASIQTPPSGNLIAVYEEFFRSVPGFAPSSAVDQPQAVANVSQARSAAVSNILAQQSIAGQPTAATVTGAASTAQQMPTGGANDLLASVYERLVAEVEARTNQLESLATVSQPNVLSAMRALHDAIMSAQRARDIFSANALVGKVVENLLENYLSANFGNEIDLMRRFGDVHVDVLKSLADRQLYGLGWTIRLCTKTLIEYRNDSRFNIDAVELLLKSRFINMQAYDSHLAQTIESHSATLSNAGMLAHPALDNALSYLLPIAFAVHLLNRYCIIETRDGVPIVNTLNECELYLTIEQLNRVVTQARYFIEQHPPLLQLYEKARQQLDSVLITSDRQLSTLCQTPPIVIPQATQAIPVVNTGNSSPLALLFSGMAQARDSDDPPGLREKSEAMLAEWTAQLQVPGGPVVGLGAPSAPRDSKLFQPFVAQLHQHIFKNDEAITRFFRINLESCIEFTYAQLGFVAGISQPQAHVARSVAYARIDALVRLMALLIKNAGDHSNPSLRINLLNRILGLTAGLLIHDIESGRHEDFQNMPYQRLLIMLFSELSAPDPAMDYLAPHVTIAFYNVLNVLRPSKCPGFVFSWLELVSHRTLLGRCVGEKRILMGYSILVQLLLNLFKFLSPYLRNVFLTQTVQTMYRGVMRFMLVLLHDFPEFLAESYYTLIDALPLNCIQLRNVILSASPRGIRLPDPIQSVRLDTMPEVQNDPRMTSIRPTDLLRSERFKAELDGYLKTRTPVTFLSEIRTHLLRTTSDSPYRYNVQLLNGLVLYVGIHAVSTFKSSASQSSLPLSVANVAHTPNMDIFQTLVVDLDSEGRYLFLNAIANHLRYPNTHTHYFHCVLLYLYKETNLLTVQEQITRVLLERVIVLRPHPWGILVTLIELLRKPEYKFWNHDFLRFAPEIERLFDSVARSCLPTPLVQQALAQLQAGRAGQLQAVSQLPNDAFGTAPTQQAAIAASGPQGGLKD